jgi:hypothetical protein
MNPIEVGQHADCCLNLTGTFFRAGKCQPLNMTTSADDALVNLTSRPVIFNGTSYSQLIGATLERELRLCIVKHHRIQLSVLARRDERFFHRGCRLIVSW